MASRAKRGLPKRTGRRKSQISCSFGSLPEKKLRRMLRSNGPRFSRKWAEKAGVLSELRSLSGKPGKIGDLARAAL